MQQILCMLKKCLALKKCEKIYAKIIYEIGPECFLTHKYFHFDFELTQGRHYLQNTIELVYGSKHFH
jgi:hypothetical protein